ncbi:ERO1-like protein beta isoform X3 [Lingula anatina]|uniref:ERO1-like protein beta isoform X3 n=1 Tax=Lingula anatina TaxID=7574 RepID=A0A1S3IRN7_LINAN|nr:ERO1-like protein beta isoform X3 [Lingula anatina]|eukprot:XP_013400738.1 ERO1-like protein beta isoform X3 [Lingula anatina]
MWPPKLGILTAYVVLGVTVTLSADEKDCFCKLKGEVDDCSCKIESLDSFNNLKIFPRLHSLLNKDYFRFFKVNLKRPCPFWGDDGRCALRDCHVDKCSEDQLPPGYKESKQEENKYTKEAQEQLHTDCKEQKELGGIDKTISSEDRESFKSWSKYDDAQDNFCELDDDNSADMEYVDLTLNPERYTGYKGESAWRIWRTIYQENCFKPDTPVPGYGPAEARGAEGKALQSGLDLMRSLKGMCLEKRVFFRMISGLHTSINVHLSAKNYLPAANGYGKGTWGPNVEEFQKRFDPETTNGEGPQRLKNLYFTYLVELRALAKAAPYLEQEDFFTGDEKEDNETRNAVKDLLKIIKSFPDQFDESRLFQGNNKEAQQLKEEFRQVFHKVYRIMNCVGCQKCRLWGKVQTQGMGTALKILFSGDTMGPDSTVDAQQKKNFQLRRSEIVSLFNAFGRLSTSIKEVDVFRQLIKEKDST